MSEAAAGAAERPAEPAQARARFGLEGHDGLSLSILAGLLAAGLILSMAASPSVAERIAADGQFDLALRHAFFAAAAVGAFLLAASAPPLWVRRAGVVTLACAFVLMVAVLALGQEIKGSTRWLQIAGLSLQPSEFAKPALVITAAWMLAERLKTPEFPGLRITAGLYALTAGLLLLQPDVGQTILAGAALALVAAAAGLAWVWLLGALAVGAGLLGAAYLLLPHVQGRIDAWLSPEDPGGYQVTRAIEAIQSGGLFGRGPGEGVVKAHLPDAHADFVFAVAAEEFGLAAMLLLIGAYAVVAWRGLARAGRLVDPFAQLAASGLYFLFALQAAIHIAVNLGLAPAKGMTLPLVSYGGSSLLGQALTLGAAAALTRARKGAFLYQQDAPDER